MQVPSWRAGGRAAPLVIAHRGSAGGGGAENTLPAFARARELGADGVELDVRLAADGEPIVFHDADLGRLAGLRGRIDALSSRHLSRVELAGGGSIPRLADALAATGDLLINLELKSPRAEGSPASPGAARLVDAVIRVVDGAIAGEGAAGRARILTSSFDPLSLARLRRRRPAWPIALLVHPGQRRALWRAALPLLRPLAIHPHEKLASARAIATWSRRGYRVHAYAVDDPARARALTAAGAGALITDDAAGVRAALTGRSGIRCPGP